MFWRSYADKIADLQGEEGVIVTLLNVKIKYDKKTKHKFLDFNELSKAKFTKGKRIIKEF